MRIPWRIDEQFQPRKASKKKIKQAEKNNFILFERHDIGINIVRGSFSSVKEADEYIDKQVKLNDYQIKLGLASPKKELSSAEYILCQAVKKYPVSKHMEQNMN